MTQAVREAGEREPTGPDEVAAPAIPRPPPPRSAPAAEPSPAERALLARLRGGDDRAFAELLRRHGDRVFELCFRMVGDRPEAEDLSQEIFVAVHRNLGRFRGESRLSTWIFRVAKNHCLNRLVYLKRRGGGRSESFDPAGDVPGEPAPGPDRNLERREQQALVQRALAALDDGQRMVVVLRDMEGLSYEEIVEVLDEPLGTVKSRLHRGRAALALAVARLEGEGGGR